MPSRLTALSPWLAVPPFVVAFALVVVLLGTWWPAGVALGLVAGTAAVLLMGLRLQPPVQAVRTAPAPERRPEPAVARVAVQRAQLAPAPAPIAVAPVAAAVVAAAPVAAAPVERVQLAQVVVERTEAQPAALVGPAAAPAEGTGPIVLPSTSFELTEDAEPTEDAEQPGIRGDLDRLKERLGDDYPDFARAAHLVVSTQYASAARLQRELALPYSRARRILTDLEQQHVVGPATGSLPRQVLLPKEELPRVERLLAEA